MSQSTRALLQQLCASFSEEDARYQTLSFLGQGGFGDVQRCFDHQLHRQVARKRLNPADEILSTERVNALLNEARLISYIDHPGVVPIYDIGLTNEDKLAYTMKVLEGETLEDRLTAYGMWVEPLALAQALPIFTRLCETMAYAHEKGVLHLDLKPTNLMVGHFGEVMILDWGSARLFDPSRYEAFLSSSGISVQENRIKDLYTGLLGTVPHMPLEQLTGPRYALTPAADIFSAGVLLYIMLTGQPPFQASNIRDYAVVLHKAPPDLRDIHEDLPAQLCAICMQMLQPNPRKRQQSFLEVLEQLRTLNTTGDRFHTRHFAPGEILLHEGDVGDFAMQLLEGEVEVSMQVENKRHVINTRKKGEIIGELAIFSDQPRTATVIAKTQTTARIMSRDDIEVELEKLPPWVSLMIRGLSNKFIEAARQHTSQEPLAKEIS